MAHWTERFYQAVDSGSPEVVRHFAPDIRCQTGNGPSSTGLAEMFAGPIGRNAAVLRGSTHRFLNIWDIDEDTAVLESEVTYHRNDGRDVTVRGVTVLHQNAAGLIDDMRLYGDMSPLFEGMADPSPVAGAAGAV